MSFLFGLQKTRDSLKEAFEALFDKYGREFDDDDEIDIMSLEVVKHHQGRRTDAQRPKKFGFLYKKKDDNASDDEGSDSDNDSDNAADLARILNERSQSLATVSVSKARTLPRTRSCRLMRGRSSIQAAFDLRLLRVVERECSQQMKQNVRTSDGCKLHGKAISRNCFDCSLINICL